MLDTNNRFILVLDSVSSLYLFVLFSFQFVNFSAASLPSLYSALFTFLSLCKCDLSTASPPFQSSELRIKWQRLGQSSEAIIDTITAKTLHTQNPKTASNEAKGK